MELSVLSKKVFLKYWSPCYCNCFFCLATILTFIETYFGFKVFYCRSTDAQLWPCIRLQPYCWLDVFLLPLIPRIGQGGSILLVTLRVDLFFTKIGPFSPSFSLFSFFQYSWQKMFNINFFRWLGSNRRPLELEATALPTEPQPLPKLRVDLARHISSNKNDLQRAWFGAWTLSHVLL